jgi:type II secretory pathway component PulK
VRARGGFVLVAALWLIIALSAVALDGALRSKAHRLVAANQLDAARSREAAMAGAEYARSRLSAAMLERADELRAEAARSGGTAARQRTFVSARLAQEDPWRDPAGLVPPAMALGEAEFVLDLRDTGLALNINQASEEMLRNFLAVGLRIDYAWADRVTQAVLDWRDEDDLPRINGGERDEYLDAGMAVLPANRSFTSVDELRHVMYMTPELFEAMRPHLTVLGSGRINLNAAPAVVLLAVPSFTESVVNELVRRRDGGQFPRNAQELRALLGSLYRPPTGQALNEFTRRVTYATNEVEINSEGRVGGSPVTARVRAIVARSDAGALLLWRSVQ